MLSSSKRSSCMIVAWVLMFFTLFMLSTRYAAADEGMWMPHQMKELNLATRGLEMDPGELYKEDGTGIMNAVVRVGMGGTGAFVSRDGLILTNHHVAFGAIQRASDKDHDYIARGFLAQTRDREIPAQGYQIRVLLGYEDVTEKVLTQLKPYRTPIARYKALDRLEKKMTSEVEKQGRDIIGDFKPMYNGNKYYLFKFKRLWDVRIVYAPPQAIGNFGGETDNWMWPRHTGDFTFLRAYVSKNNQGVPYSPENVPYRPTSFLKVSIDGIEEGDFTFSMGYPGTTRRSYTFSEFQEEIENMKDQINSRIELIAFLEKAGETDRDIQIKYASQIRSLQNGSKNRQAKLEGFQKHSIPEKKKIFDEKSMEWIKQQPEGQKKYGNILIEIENFLQRNKDFFQGKQRTEDLVGITFGPVLLTQAHLVVRTVEERQKPDSQREKGFQDKDLINIQTRIEVAERSYHLDTEKAYFKFFLKKMLNQDKSLWQKALVPVLEKVPGEIDQYADQLYASTILTNPAKRLELIRLKPGALLALRDPLIRLAIDLEKELKVSREKEKALEQERSDLKRAYLAALLERAQGKIAPDANGTIRFTYGPVKSYCPRDGVTFLAQTTLKGIMEKETGSLPFIVPEKLKQLWQVRDFGRYMDKNLGDVATCFMNTTCVTGGSSGSPVMNARGEMIGISFDMVYESVVGDYFIVPEFQRVINVDLRYVMYITDKFAGARHLLEEMGI